MAKVRGESSKNQDDYVPAKKLTEPFESIFGKLFDKDEQMVWLAPMEPHFDRDMQTIILTPKTMFAYDWVMNNYRTRLNECCKWRLMRPIPEKQQRGIAYQRADILKAMRNLDALAAEPSKPMMFADMSGHGMQQLNFSACVPALRSLGLSMLGHLDKQASQQMQEAAE